MKDKTRLRGFASMDRERHRAICSAGGKAVPDNKRSFSRNRKLASSAGRKGGASVPGEKRSFYTNRKLASKAGGSKGGRGGTNNKGSS